MSHDWNAKIYSQFLDLRTRPAQDLLAAFPENFQPKMVYDLGCGPGNSTILLKKRWPHAKVVGIDSSEEMLHEAKASYPELTFIKSDIAHFNPKENIDCLFANASLQWLEHHETLIPHLLKQISLGGAFGFQMPNNFHAPTHQITLQLLQNNPNWHRFVPHLRYGKLHQPLYQLPWYYDGLSKAGASDIQIWETEYFQEMANHQEIFNWMQGTGLRPIWSKMNIEHQELFKKDYIEFIQKEYPIQPNGKILLPFRRIFMMGFMAY